MRLLLAALGLATVASVVWLLLHAERVDLVRTGAAGEPTAVDARLECRQAVERRLVDRARVEGVTVDELRKELEARGEWVQVDPDRCSR